MGSTNPIILSGQVSATDADILQGTRLQTVPGPGFLLFELQSSDNDATNHYTATIQLPGGDNPMNGTRVPCGNTAGLAGVLDERTKIAARFRVNGGGHTVFSLTETGDAECTYRVTFFPVVPVV